MDRRQRTPERQGIEDDVERLAIPPGADQLARAVHLGGERRDVAKVRGQPAVAVVLVGQ